MLALALVSEVHRQPQMSSGSTAICPPPPGLIAKDLATSSRSGREIDGPFGVGSSFAQSQSRWLRKGLILQSQRHGSAQYATIRRRKTRFDDTLIKRSLILRRGHAPRRLDAAKCIPTHPASHRTWCRARARLAPRSHGLAQPCAPIIVHLGKHSQGTRTNWSSKSGKAGRGVHRRAAAATPMPQPTTTCCVPLARRRGNEQ